MAMGEPLPKQIFGHPWLLQGEGKMSKSKGNVIYADDLARLFGVDAVRYFVLHEMPFDNDGQITWELVCERFNTELANVLGNLVSRTIAMMNKYFGGKVARSMKANEETPDEEFKATVSATAKKVEEKMEGLRVADAISEIFNTLRRANKYIDETMPWALAKDESKAGRLNDVLYNLVDTILTCASLLESFMPETAAKIYAAFGVQAKSLEECATFGWAEEYTANPVPALFQRLDFKSLEPEIEKIAAEQKASVKAAEPTAPATPVAPAAAPAQETAKEPAPKKAEISFEDFEKIELRVGEIIACEAVPKSNKLLKETVKFGDEVRTIVSGIAKHYKPEEMVGKKVVFVTNLAPRKICGIMSEGMILAAEDENGTLSLCVSDKAELLSGANCG